MKYIIPSLLFTFITFQSFSEEFVISLEKNGILSWTNSISNAVYQIEWKSSLNDGEWRTDSPFEHFASNSDVITNNIPMFFRVTAKDAEDIYREDKLRFYDNTYLITFKAADKADGQTVRDLLDCHNRNADYEALSMSHHFRTIPNIDELIGKICANTTNDISSYINSLTQSSEIIVINVMEPTFDEFIAHTKTKQESL